MLLGNKQKKISICIFSLSLFLSNLCPVNSNPNILQKDKERINQEQTKLKEEVQKIEGTISKEVSERDSIRKEIKESKQKIDFSNQQEFKLNIEITKLQREIEELNLRVKKKLDSLKSALSKIYKSNEVRPIDIVLNVSKFEDWIDKMGIAKQVNESVSIQIVALTSDMKSLEEKKHLIKIKSADLNKEIEKLNREKIHLQKLIDKKNKIIDEKNISKKKAQQEIDENSEEIKKIQQKIDEYYREQEERIRQQKLLEEKQRKAQEEQKKVQNKKTTQEQVKVKNQKNPPKLNQDNNYGSTTICAGSHVRTGQLIGYVGSTGHSTGPHLHFEIRRNGVRIDPGGLSNFNMYNLIDSPILYVTSGFTDKINRSSQHCAIDLAGPRVYGSKVFAFGSGVVIHAGPLGGYGNLIIIIQNDGLVAYYGHLSGFARV
ncbi:MAG: peptidase [Candidatus Paraimprobicoccus trichonymphae]|uniref:Peptidase n=1 Tax=Candidatus Paraimprobicoccus trichonymphae TaxID=3033793 RepID=A0AA48I9Z2_9FIRM|nr:MAG: peptidase [Candidatus Paraimprobicoccus trichonymphae]